jgi:hypothetical protein
VTDACHCASPASAEGEERTYTLAEMRRLVNPETRGEATGEILRDASQTIARLRAEVERLTRDVAHPKVKCVCFCDSCMDCERFDEEYAATNEETKG